MNISKESLQDISEEDPALLEENSRTDKDAENYHISMLTRRQTAGFNDLSGKRGGLSGLPLQSQGQNFSRSGGKHVKTHFQSNK